jgi:pimeloyl-ACP methyl ester carboxylesterase
MNKIQDQLVWQGEIAIALRDYGGDGSPLILLHGGTRNLGDWELIAPVLTAHHRVIALDFRSHGASTPCETIWTLADAVADVQAVIRALDLDAPWLVGHSLGGLVATCYAAEQRASRGVVNLDGVGVSLPEILPDPHPHTTRQHLRAMIAEMAEILVPVTAASPMVYAAHEVADRLATLHAQTVERAGSWELTRPTAARSWYRLESGFYQENPSSAAVAALSAAVVEIDIFALTRAVRCPLLFVGAIDPAASRNDHAAAPDLMQLWRHGVQLTIEQIGREHPNVAWRGVAGDHMLVPNQAAAVAEVVLRFTSRMGAEMQR